MNAPWVMVAVPNNIACVLVAPLESSVRLIGLRVVWIFGRDLDSSSGVRVVWLFGRESDSGSGVQVDGSSEDSRQLLS